MSVKKQNYLLLVTGLVLGVLVSIGHGVLAEREAARATLPVEELRTFSDVFGRIKNDYVESVEDKTRIPVIWMSNSSRSCRSAPPASSAGSVSRSAWKTVL
jgi:hypothetical protein